MKKILSAVLVLGLSVFGSGCKREACTDETGPVAPLSEKWKSLNLVPTDGKVCFVLPGDMGVDMEVVGKNAQGLQAALEVQKKLEAQGYTEDTHREVERGHGTFQLAMHKGFDGVLVRSTYIGDKLDAVLGGKMLLDVGDYDPCAIPEWMREDPSVESSVSWLLSHDKDEFACEELRMVLPHPKYISEKAKGVPAYVAQLTALQKDPKPFLDLLAKAKAEGRTEVTVKRAKTLDDPLYEGKRKAFAAIFSDTPELVLLGGKPLGWFGYVANSTFDKQWAYYGYVPDVDALNLPDEPKGKTVAAAKGATTPAKLR